MNHKWNPRQYEKFEKERNEPFFDLLQLIKPMQHPRILDLGCGNGALTKILHEKLHSSYTLGIDASKEMLALTANMQMPNLMFKEENIEKLVFEEPFNLIMSNAALQWVPNHHDLFKKLTEWLAPGGQMAVQMPANQNFPTHTIAAELAAEVPYKHAFTGKEKTIHHRLEMEEYAILFENLGYESQVVRLQLYAHFLDSTASVVEWVKGSLLTYYQSALEPPLYEQFLKDYRSRLIEKLGWSEPFFFPMKRLFLWAQLPEQ